MRQGAAAAVERLLYPQRAGVHDELVDASGAVRPLWRPFVDALMRMGADGWRQTDAYARRLLDEAGLSFNPYVEDVGAAGDAGVDVFDPRRLGADGIVEGQWPIDHSAGDLAAVGHLA